MRSHNEYRIRVSGRIAVQGYETLAHDGFTTVEWLPLIAAA
jgi:hypothetical protein